MRRRFVRFSMWVLIAIAAGAGAFALTKQRILASITGPPLNVRPYVMYLSQTNYERSEAGVPVLDHLEFRRRDGSTALWVYSPGSPPRRIGARVDWMDGGVMAAFDEVKARMSGWLGGGQAASRKRRLAQPPPGCAYPGEQTAGEETVFGQRAVKVIRDPGGEASMRSTYWRLKDFECTSLRALTEKRQPDGSWKKIFEARPLWFSELEPDPQVFEKPGDCAEMRPSEIRKRLMERAGMNAAECAECAQMDHEADAGYLRAQAPER